MAPPSSKPEWLVREGGEGTQPPANRHYTTDLKNCCGRILGPAAGWHRDKSLRVVIRAGWDSSSCLIGTLEVCVRLLGRNAGKVALVV